MDILQPAIADMISQHYECSVEIELVFSGKVLVDKGMHYDDDIKPSQGGNLTTPRQKVELPSHLMMIISIPLWGRVMRAGVP